MRILLTVGHSILKSGAITSADGTIYGGGNEYRYCKQMSKHLEKFLEANGHEVDRIVCPEKLFTASTQERDYKLAIEKATRYDLLIELHLNAAENKYAEGCEVLYKSNAGKKYADKVQKQLATMFKDRGTKQSDSLYILNQTRCPAILIESFFCTNKKEWKKAKNKKKVASLIAKGIGK